MLFFIQRGGDASCLEMLEGAFGSSSLQQWRVWSREETFKSAIFPSVDVLESMCFQSSDYLLSCVTDSFTRSASFRCFNRSFMSPPVCRFISTCGSRSESSDLASARPALPVHGDPQLGRSVSQHNPGPPPHVVCVLWGHVCLHVSYVSSSPASGLFSLDWASAGKFIDFPNLGLTLKRIVYFCESAS